jgi:hypothetical protein
MVLTAEDSVGGFVGYNNGIISTSTLQVDQNLSISGIIAVGGFVGSNGSFGDISTTQFNASTVEMFALGGSFDNALAGGFVGENYGLINDVVYQSTNLDITSSGLQVGGFVGYNDGTIVSGVIQVNQTISVSGLETVGGFVGFNDGLIQNLSVTADTLNVTATAINVDSDVGGFAGYNGGDIINSLVSANNINITGDVYLGGYVGYNNGNISSSNLQVENTLNLSGTSVIGGFGGYNFGLITNVQMSSLILNIEAVTSNDNFVGGFVGHNRNDVTNISFINSQSIIIQAAGRRVGGFIGSHNDGLVSLIHIDTSDIIIHQNTSANPGTTGGFIGEIFSADIRNINVINNTVTINASGSISEIGGFTGRLSNGNIENVQMINQSGLTLNVPNATNTAYFVGGDSSTASNDSIISGVYFIYDSNSSSISSTSSNSGIIIGRIVLATSTNPTLTLNEVYYNSGLLSTDKWIEAIVITETNGNKNILRSSGDVVGDLSEVNSSTLLAIINNDDVFEVTDNSFPTLKVTGTITATRQQDIQILWID